MNKFTEKDIIELFSSGVSNNPAIINGIGDDCAVIEKNSTHYLLISKDVLVEDVHFRLSTSNATAIAMKAVNCNLSDIAACGGTPLYILLGISCPANISFSWLEEFSGTFKKVCQQHNISIVGGDTTSSPDKLYLSITIIGEVVKNNLKLRSTAKAGDYIALTGNLGDSALGLFALENQLPNRFEQFIARHRNALARTEEGKWLGTQHTVTAMMDLSDGIHTDLKRMIEASKAGAEVEIDHLPYRKELTKLAEEYNFNIYDLLLGGGEDYELLFTIDPPHLTTLLKDFSRRFNIKLTIIGNITSNMQLRYLQKGKLLDLQFKSFNHFGG